MVRKMATVIRMALRFSQEKKPGGPSAERRRSATEEELAGFFSATGANGTEAGRRRVTGTGRGGQLKGARPYRTRPPKDTRRTAIGYDRCLETSLVMSNMLTCALPPKTGFSLSSALMARRFFASCRPFFLM